MPNFSTQHISNIYEASREYSTILAGYKHMMMRQEEDKAIKHLEENRDRLTVLTPMAKVAKVISKLNKEIDRINTDKDLTAKEKREEIDNLLKKRNLAALDSVKNSGERKGNLNKN